MAPKASPQVSGGLQPVGLLLSILNASSLGRVWRGFLIITCILLTRYPSDPRDITHIFEQMYKGSLYYGRKGLPVATISVIDLALWDLLGKIRQEPVYKLIGGATRSRLHFYCTGPEPGVAKDKGFVGAKVALPYGPDEGRPGLLKNIIYLKEQRQKVGPDFPLRVDCYMSLNVSYTIDLVSEAEREDLRIDWWEECLSPDDFDGQALLKRAHPKVKFTTGEHEYSRYGFRKLIEGRNVDIIQPDIMWLGGMSELLKVASMAAAYDVPVVPHASGPYSYHFVVSQPNTPFHEYLANSPDGKSVYPVFGDLFLDEPIPTHGYVDVSELDKPGFGLELNPKARIIDANAILNPSPPRNLSMTEANATDSLPEQKTSQKTIEKPVVLNGVLHSDST